MLSKKLWYDAEYWEKKFLAAWLKRKELYYRKLAKRCLIQLRRIRHDEAWMRGIDPLSFEYRHSR